MTGSNATNFWIRQLTESLVSAGLLLPSTWPLWSRVRRGSRLFKSASSNVFTSSRHLEQMNAGTHLELPCKSSQLSGCIENGLPNYPRMDVSGV